MNQIIPACRDRSRHRGWGRHEPAAVPATGPAIRRNRPGAGR